jgi:hypothetical protein
MSQFIKCRKIFVCSARARMMRRASVIAFILLFLTGSTGLIGLDKLGNTSNASLQIVTVSVSPSSTTILTNQNFTIGVNVSGVSDLFGWEFQLGWNSTFLDAVDVSEGEFLKTGGSTFFTYRSNTTAGNIIVDCTLTGNILGVSGGGTLARVTFYAKGVGECPLNLHDVTLLDSAGQLIPSQAVSGYGYFTPQESHDVAVTNVTASPVAALPGDIVNVSVTVQDDGSFAEVFNLTVYVNSQVIGVQSVSLGSGSSTIVTFAWNTTGFGKGDYVLLASASIVPGEVNIINNNMQATSPVTLLYNGHDIAISAVEPSKTVVGQGYGALITVTAKDYGIYPEAFNVTVYVNGTAIYVQPVNLESGASIALTPVWNTTDFAYGNYTMSAYASPVPGENDTTNNSFISEIAVHVGVPGDVSSALAGAYDGIVNMRDIAYLVVLFDTKPSSINWNPNADVNGDGVVNVRDIAIAVYNFAEHE